MPAALALLFRYFWFILVLVILWNGHVWRRNAKKLGTVAGEGEPADELITRVVVRPMVLVSILLGGIQLVARGPTPMFMFCPGPGKSWATVSIIIAAAFSLLLVTYVWRPTNAANLGLIFRTVGLPDNLLLARLAITVSQVGFWAGLLTGGFDCAAPNGLLK